MSFIQGVLAREQTDQENSVLFLNFIPVVNCKFRMNLHQAEGIPSPIHLLLHGHFTLKLVK